MNGANAVLSQKLFALTVYEFCGAYRNSNQYFARNAMKGVTSIGTDFATDIHSCVADYTGIYRMATEKAKKGSGCKR